MKHTFYDVKEKKKVELEVLDKVAYQGKSGTRYAFEAKTADGRKIMSFVGKQLWEDTNI